MVRPLAWAVMVALRVACREGHAAPGSDRGYDDRRAAPADQSAVCANAGPDPAPDPTAMAAATYRAWMEEARLVHPYSESLETMWAVMIGESSGDATVVAGEYHGLFQYSRATWAGTWNPYRDQPILDPRPDLRDRQGLTGRLPVLVGLRLNKPTCL